ncbi:MAG TPA: hypothetical protein VGS58_00900, partial [Candidatus Sulfopaludibacter sp.]|nr:hypothetical protein [Candidatus Sulfopaludibacter sp.]
GTIPLTADFLPVPAIFDLPPIPAFPGGGTVTETTDNQSLSDTTGAPGFSQAILGAMDFVYSRDTAQFHSADLVALAALVNSTQQFFPIPAPGQFPGSWSITNPGGNAIFSFFELVQDKAIDDATHHFGLSSDYDVAGNLTLDSASGGLVAPEPGTLPVMVGLALVWGIRRATSGRRGARAAESARASARTAAGAAFSFSSRGTTLSKVSAALCGME